MRLYSRVESLRPNTPDSFWEGLEESYPPYRVQVYEKHGAPMDSLKSILAGLLATAGPLANPSDSF